MPPRPPFNRPRQKRSPLRRTFSNLLRANVAGWAVGSVTLCLMAATILRGVPISLASIRAILPDVGVVWSETVQAKEPQPVDGGSVSLPAKPLPPPVSDPPVASVGDLSPSPEPGIEAPEPMTIEVEQGLTAPASVQAVEAPKTGPARWIAVTEAPAVRPGPTLDPRVVTRFDAELPAEARELGLAPQTINVSVYVSREGIPAGVRADGVHSLLRHAAENAVKQWTFEPALMDGHPVATMTYVRVTLR
jgi:periplasmic protein TonB